MACQARPILNSKLLSDQKLQDIQQHHISGRAEDVSYDCAPPELETQCGDSAPASGAFINISPQSDTLDDASECETLLSFVKCSLTDVTISEDLKETYNQICLRLAL